MIAINQLHKYWGDFGVAWNEIQTMIMFWHKIPQSGWKMKHDFKSINSSKTEVF
jgi:hypothetical protein